MYYDPILCYPQADSSVWFKPYVVFPDEDFEEQKPRVGDGRDIKPPKSNVALHSADDHGTRKRVLSLELPERSHKRSAVGKLIVPTTVSILRLRPCIS